MLAGRAVDRGAAITVHGSPEQKEMFLEGLYRGDLFACQPFSEPEHGSDLAGTSTRAVRDGDEWIVNGQKAWSRAQASGPDDVPDRHGPAGDRGADADPDDRRACSLAGPAAVADTGAWGRYSWGRLRPSLPGLRVAGGTDEIQRNILSERVLGLPREPAG